MHPVKIYPSAHVVVGGGFPCADLSPCGGSGGTLVARGGEKHAGLQGSASPPIISLTGKTQVPSSQGPCVVFQRNADQISACVSTRPSISPVDSHERWRRVHISYLGGSFERRGWRWVWRRRQEEQSQGGCGRANCTRGFFSAFLALAGKSRRLTSPSWAFGR